MLSCAPKVWSCYYSRHPEGQNGTVDKVKSALTNAIYLQDSWVEIDGLKIYGSPWVPLPDFKVNWAFGLQRGEVKTLELLITFFQEKLILNFFTKLSTNHIEFDQSNLII